MKRSFVALLAVAILGILTCAPGFATGKTMSFSMDLVGPSITASATSPVLDTGNLLPKLVFYSGSATVSATDATATLTGNYNDKIWQYEESVDNNVWTGFAALVNTLSAPAYGTSFSTASCPAPYSTTARYFRLSYNATLSSTQPSSASGSGTLTAVPEPSGLAVLAASAVGLVGFVRKRK